MSTHKRGLAAASIGCLLSLVVAGGLARPAAAIDPGTVKGPFEVNGKPIALAHAVALRRANPDKLGLADGPEVRLLLTDREVAPAVLDSVTPERVREAARELGFAGLMVAYEPPEAPAGTVAAARLTLFVPGLADPMGQPPSYSASDSRGIFKALKDANNRLTGTLEHATGGVGTIPPFRIQVDFGAPMFHEAPAKERLSGAAARASAPAKAFLANVEAFWNFDPARIKALSTAARWRQMEPMLAAAPPKEAIREQMKEAGQTPAAAAESISAVVIREADAVVLFRDKSGARGWQEMWWEGGEWRLR
jgi:hypothetical protein